MSSNIVDLKRLIVEIAYQAGEGHIPSSFSILDILWVLYEKILRVDPKNAAWPERDRFVLSKGHASLGLYAILAQQGFLSIDQVKSFGRYHSILGGHPDRNKVPGVEVSSGSLGHGFPISVGIALGLKIQRKNARVFALIGDGEANEGTIWESALLASHHSLSNLCCIIDYNHSTDRALKVGDLAEKFRSFGWESCTINGHNHKEIFDALSQKKDRNCPFVVVAETIKGYGCKTMENNPAWHHKSPSGEELKTILEELS